MKYLYVSIISFFIQMLYKIAPQFSISFWNVEGVDRFSKKNIYNVDSKLNKDRNSVIEFLAILD